MRVCAQSCRSADGEAEREGAQRELSHSHKELSERSGGEDALSSEKKNRVGLLDSGVQQTHTGNAAEDTAGSVESSFGVFGNFAKVMAFVWKVNQQYTLPVTTNSLR